MPGLKPTGSVEKTITSKPVVIRWLKRSLDAVKDPHLAAKPTDLGRKVHIADRDVTIDGMYLRILVHDNEHMGQLIAYARMTGVLPPWAKE
jgi:uncharacterized damage-inducible protein DinB